VFVPDAHVVDTYMDIILDFLEQHRNDDDFMELKDKIQEFMLYFERAWLGKMVVSYQ
jgi:hypothetical protein